MFDAELLTATTSPPSAVQLCARSLLVVWAMLPEAQREAERARDDKMAVKLTFLSGLLNADDDPA
jgi:hypothetical protein